MTLPWWKRSATEPGGQLRLEDGREIGYSVVRTAQRTQTISIQLRGGTVVVRAPLRTSAAEISSAVAKRAGWIATRLGETTFPAAAPKLAHGRPLPWRGGTVSFACERLPVARPAIALEDGILRARIPEATAASAEAAIVEALVKRWYAESALEAVSAAVAEWAPRMDVQPRSVLIRDQRSRWGSCARDGTLRINWRVAVCDASLLDYVVVHELAHLRHPDHQAGFWALVGATLPDFASRRAALRRVSSPF